MQYEMKIEDVCLRYAFHRPLAARWFEWHMRPADGAGPDPIVISEELLEKRRSGFWEGTPEDYMEYRVLVEQTGRALADRGRFLFHGVAFMWRGYAWLFTAPSGTGKTTQFLNWKRLWPEEVRILCGDMPILSRREDGRVWVNPSPWNGSERMGFDNHDAFPLGGIIYLKQGKKNVISPMRMSEAVRPLWHKCIGQAETEAQIRAREHFLDAMLRQYPLWKLVNLGDDASAELTRTTLERYMEEEQL